MSEKRFVYHEEYFPLNVSEIIDNKIGKTYDCEDATDVLNELFNENEQLKEENEKLIQKKCLPCELVNLQTREIDKLKEENEQLRQQIQNYEKLISNSYVGIEETLDGFVGKYVIWEDELQKYKNKNEMINNE